LSVLRSSGANQQLNYLVKVEVSEQLVPSVMPLNIDKQQIAWVLRPTIYPVYKVMTVPASVPLHLVLLLFSHDSPPLKDYFYFFFFFKFLKKAPKHLVLQNCLMPLILLK